MSQLCLKLNDFLNLYYNTNNYLGQYLSYGTDITIDLCMAYMLMLVSITLTVMQGHSGSAEENTQRWIISTTKKVRDKF